MNDTSKKMNAWIRGALGIGAPVEPKPEAQAVGNAGAGTGNPPPVKKDMNLLIRKLSGR